MAKDSIEIKWSSADATDYEASIAALQSYEGHPEIKVAIRLNGKIKPDSVAEIIKIAKAHGATIGVSLKAQWPAEDDVQLRLFPPDYGAATAADIENWLIGN